MLHLFMGKEPWFRAKNYGFGAGLPIRWQGWALLATYLLAATGILRLVAEGSAAMRGLAIALMLLVTTIFLIVCRKRTEGGWHWRWGSGR